MSIRSRGRKAYSAVAHYDCGNAMPERWSELFIPRHLRIIVGMHIDPCWRDQQAISIDRARSAAKVFADSGDTPTTNGHISCERWFTSSVNDRSTTD